VLSRYLGVTPDAVSLDRSATGKPSLTRELRDRSAIMFNLSHAHNRALIAVSQAQEVGVDLECVRPEVEVTKLSKRYFTRSEHTAIWRLLRNSAPRDSSATGLRKRHCSKHKVSASKDCSTAKSSLRPTEAPRKFEPDWVRSSWIHFAYIFSLVKRDGKQRWLPRA